MKKLKFCVVVVWYNPSTKEVNNLKNYRDCKKVYVVDNSDKNNSYLIKHSKNIEYLPNYKNLGIAVALNIGCKSAIKEKYTHILTIDQDTDFPNKEIKKYFGKIEKLSRKQKDIAMFTPRIGNRKGFIEYGITSGSCFSLKILEELKFFDEGLFIDEVDFDLCYKLREKNYKMFQFDDVLINHGEDRINKINFFGYKFMTFGHDYKRKYYMVRNRFYMIKRYPGYTKGYRWIIFKFVLSILFEKDRLRKLIYCLKGYLDYKMGITGKLKE